MRLLLLICLAITAMQAEDVIIDDYEFTWKIGGTGDYSVEAKFKDNETTIYLATDRDYNSFTIAEAKWLGETLAKVKEFQKALETDPNPKIIKHGKLRSLTFSKSESGVQIEYKYGSDFMSNTIKLSRGEARKLGSMLKTIDVKAKAVRTRLNEILD